MILHGSSCGNTRDLPFDLAARGIDGKSFHGKMALAPRDLLGLPENPSTPFAIEVVTD